MNQDDFTEEELELLLKLLKSRLLRQVIIIEESSHRRAIMTGAVQKLACYLEEFQCCHPPT